MRGARLSRLRAALALLLLGSLGACATLTESTQQTVYVQTVQDHVEVVGVLRR